MSIELEIEKTNLGGPDYEIQKSSFFVGLVVLFQFLNNRNYLAK